jgi:hypothetical protein
MKIADLGKIEEYRKSSLKKIKDMRPVIAKKVKDILPDVKIVQVKPVGSVTDKKLFREDSGVDVGVYVKSDQYESGMNKELTARLKDVVSGINVIVFVIEDKILTELRKVGYENDYEGKQIIIAPDGYVFIFDDKNMDDIDQVLLDRYNNDVEGIQEETENGYHKFIMGAVNKNKLLIAEMSESDLTSVFSASIKKVIKELNLDGLVYENSYHDMDHDISRDDIISATFKTFEMYHGTNSRYIMQILKKGIMPTKHTNFDKIFHKDKIFFTSKKNYAAWHSVNSASKNNGIPLIVKFKIPDESKIVLDYDVAIKLYGIDHPLTKKLGYEFIYKNASRILKTWDNDLILKKKKKPQVEDWRKLADKASLNTRAGIFGYVGRIPPSHITGIYVDPDMIPQIASYLHYGEMLEEYEESDENNMVLMSVERFKKALDEAIAELETYDDDEDY